MRKQSGKRKRIFFRKKGNFFKKKKNENFTEKREMHFREQKTILSEVLIPTNNKSKTKEALTSISMVKMVKIRV